MWSVEFTADAARDLKRLDPQVAREILSYLRKRIATDDDPRRFGKALRGEKQGFWRYRVGDYRLICLVEDEKLTVLVLRAAHRKEVYG
jgi:mRNA interferase RelE/StbE